MSHLTKKLPHELTRKGRLPTFTTVQKRSLAERASRMVTGEARRRRVQHGNTALPSGGMWGWKEENKYLRWAVQWPMDAPSSIGKRSTRSSPQRRLGFGTVGEGVGGIEPGKLDRRARRQYGVESPSGSGRDTEVAGLVELGWAHWQFLETGSSGECARPDPQDEERKPATW
jgi:hypothetical protein